MVWIADREGDFWDYLTKLTSENELFVQRAVYKRAVEECDSDCFDYVRSSEVIGEDSFYIDSQGGNVERKKRLVVCEIRTKRVVIKKPRNLPRETSKLEVQIIHVREKDSDMPIEWFLITNVFAETLEEILERIRWYRLRWEIEELHRVVKSGCGVEEMRLEGKEKLIKLLFLLFVVGQRILWITKLSKECPEWPCTEVFSEEEWQLLYVRKHKKLPDDVPTVGQATRLLAMLGGFYAYNKKRIPGAMTIWRGFRRLSEGLLLMERLSR